MSAKKKTASVKFSSILQEADALINGQRQEDYGDTFTNFVHIATLWNATLAMKLDEPITPEDVALCMMQVKIARAVKSPHHKDSILDIAGYAGCHNKLRIQRVNQQHPLPGILKDPAEDGE